MWEGHYLIWWCLFNLHSKLEILPSDASPARPQTKTCTEFRPSIDPVLTSWELRLLLRCVFIRLTPTAETQTEQKESHQWSFRQTHTDGLAEGQQVGLSWRTVKGFSCNHRFRAWEQKDGEKAADRSCELHRWRRRGNLLTLVSTELYGTFGNGRLVTDVRSHWLFEGEHTDLPQPCRWVSGVTSQWCHSDVRV